MDRSLFDEVMSENDLYIFVPIDHATFDL